MLDLRPMSTVSIARCATYEPSTLESALSAALSPLGGMAAFVSPGQRVLLKVNLLAKAVPERAVTTHPELLRAVIRSVREAGGVPMVGDSPGGPATAGFLRGVHQASGIEKVCAEEDVELLVFDDCVRVHTKGSSLYGAFTIARPAVECDVLISVPKFKTHGFMMFTGAVKNLFGVIPGLEKAQYHLKVPNRDDFGAMLVDLMLACKPALAVMDAVVGMEGDGPAGGSPRQIGALIASADSPALDVVASAMAGLDPMEVYTNKSAAGRGLCPRTADEVDVVGTPWRELAPEGFVLPARDVSAGMPKWLGSRLTSWTTAKPYLEKRLECTKCRKCEESCPVGAILVGSDGPGFDYSKCIRCYCCQELCPPQAISLRVPPLASFMTRLSRR